MDSHAKVIPLHLHPMGFIENFVHFGAALDPLLHETGIDFSALGNGVAKISYGQQLQLVRNGIALCKTPGLGLLIGNRWDWVFEGTVGSLIHCSPSLQDASEALRRYQMIAQPYYTTYVGKPLGYIDRNDTFVFPLRHFPMPDNDDAIIRFELEYRLAITLRLWEMCGNHSVANPAVHVRLAYPRPAYAHLYEDLACSSLEFNAEKTEVSVHKAFRSKPFRLFRQGLYAKLTAQCEEELRQSGLEQTTAAAVRACISAHYNKQLPLSECASPLNLHLSLEETAKALKMNPRALSRKLAAEQTTFRKILQDARIDLTLYQLQSSRLTVDQIAELTGFASASSMRRAIRSAVGRPVSLARRTGAQTEGE